MSDPIKQPKKQDSASAGTSKGRRFFVDLETSHKGDFVRVSREQGGRKLQDWVEYQLCQAVAAHDLKDFTLEGSDSQGRPVLVGGGFEIPLGVSRDEAQEFTDFLNRLVIDAR